MIANDGIVAVLLLLAGVAASTAVLIALMMPLLDRYALARPNARSSHVVPTPQGGGIAIIAVLVCVVGLFTLDGAPGFQAPWVAAVVGTALALAVVGAVDDISPLPVLPRLLVQFMAASALVSTLPVDTQALPFLPWWLERIGLVVALVWFINLTNFMDGIDWMTVVETVPLLAVLAALGFMGTVEALSTLMPVTVCLLGGMIGFAPYNRHVAQLFLGDVGSLPLGALGGWLLIALACSGHLAAALILPLYYLADATFTLGWRLWRGEAVGQAHRSHFYQVATLRGFSVRQVTARVLMLNAVLAVLAYTTVVRPHLSVQVLASVAAAAATLWLLRTFTRGRERMDIGCPSQPHSASHEALPGGRLP